MSLFAGIEMPNRPSLENVRRLDLLPIPFIRKAHRLGMAIDREHFHALGSKFRAEMDTLAKDISSYIPPDRLLEFSEKELDDDIDMNVGSPEQVAKLLFDMLNVDTEDLKRTATGKVSTGKKQLETIRLRHPVVPKILRHRQLNTLITKYCNSLPKQARFHPKGNDCPVCELSHGSESWRIHGTMGTTRAETGRINHKNPNLGNIPTRSEDGQDVQAGFIAPPGTRIVTRDKSQIELRDLAHLSNCKSMIDVYKVGGDIHDHTARRVFNIPQDVKPDKYKHRMAAKRVNFGIQNGTTEHGLYLQLVMDYGENGLPIPDWLTKDWCKEFIVKWLEAYSPEVPEWFEVQHYRARRYGMSWEPFGRVRLIPEVKSTHGYIRQAGLRQAQNFPVTSLAAGQLKLDMGLADRLFERVYDAGVWCHGLLTIHDCIKAEVEEDAAEDVLEGLGEAMDSCMDDERGVCQLRVPVESDGHVSERWT